MFSRHVTKQISAYCHGELSSEESKKFAEHIISCVKCRTKFEEVKLGIKLAEQLPKLSAPKHLWSDVEYLLDTPPPAPVSSPLWSWPVQVAAAAVLIIIVSFVALRLSGPPSIPPQRIPQMSANPWWYVTRVDGTPKIGTQGISDDGRLGVGEWLETDGSSRARIAVGAIGNVEIDPNTRVRLIANEPTEHRLELARGRLSARIWAPPRLFFVDTPSAVAADMGCAYSLEVDDDGSSLLHVTSGWVELGSKDRVSIVPADAVCRTRPGFGPGTPYFADASRELGFLLDTIDFGHNDEHRNNALTSLLNQARPRDSLTLWHLLSRLYGSDRVRVYEKMVTLVPPPPGVTREGVLQLDKKMLDDWKLTFEWGWIGGGGGKKGKYLKDQKEQKVLSEKMKQMIPQ